MKRRRANLTPCRFCGRLWSPPAGATPLHYCRACSKERQVRATAQHTHLTTVRHGKYLLNIDTSEPEGERTPRCLRCNTNEAGSAGVCEPCFQWWLKQNEDVFMSPYGAINGFVDPLIPQEQEPEPRQRRENLWHAVDVALQAIRNPQWPTPRNVATDPPPPGRALLWIGNGLNEWRSVEILPAQDDADLVGQTLYMLDSGHIEYASVLSQNAYWLPLPPAPEGRADG